jgi:hypothetical protein
MTPVIFHRSYLIGSPLGRSRICSFRRSESNIICRSLDETACRLKYVVASFPLSKAVTFRLWILQSLRPSSQDNVTVAVGGRQSVVVHADSNLLRDVTTRVVAGTLVVGTTGSFSTRSPMSVEVSVPSLASLTLSGSG